MIQILEQRPVTVREIAAAMQMRMADVVDDLDHVKRSLGKRLVVGRSTCEACGNSLRRDERFTAPSRCPRCKSERTSEPEIWVE